MELGEVDDDDDDDCISCRGARRGWEGRKGGNTQTRVRKESVATPYTPPYSPRSTASFPVTHARIRRWEDATLQPPLLVSCNLTRRDSHDS